MIDELNKDSLFCALVQYLAVRFKALNSATDKAAICNKTPPSPCKLSSDYQAII